RGTHDFQALVAGQMHNIEMRTGDFREIERGLDRQRLGDGRVRVLPILQCTFGLANLQFIARGIDQRASFAVNTGNRVGPERRNLAKAAQQNVVGHRLHDARYARHVELERADTELLGIPRNFLDLLLGENLGMEHGVDIAALVHCLAESGEVIEVRIFQTAQENSDASHPTENRRARFGFGFAFVRLFVADVDVWVKNSWQPRASGGVVGLGARVSQIFADHGDLAVGDSDVGLDWANARDDQRAIPNDEVERLVFAAFRHDLTFSVLAQELFGEPSEGLDTARALTHVTGVPASAWTAPPRGHS